MILIALVVIFVVTFLILSIPVFLIEWIIGKFNPRLRDISSLRIVQTAFKGVLLLSGTRLTVIGRERIPRDKPVLYIGNHRSMFDIPVVYSLCPDLTGFMSKIEIAKVPLLSTWMRFLHCVFLNRGDKRAGIMSVNESINNVKNGISMVIFPEGTRSKGEEGDMLEFKPGSFKVAQRTGCPVVLVALNNTRAAFEAQFPKIRRTHIVVEFSEPFTMADTGFTNIKDLSSHCQEQLREMIANNKTLV